MVRLTTSFQHGIALEETKSKDCGGLDHKIYASVAGNGGLVRRADRPDQTPVSVSRKDFRFDPVTKEFDSISGGKQFGNTFDDWGNRFLCTQDTAVYQVVLPQRYLERNPFLSLNGMNVRRKPKRRIQLMCVLCLFVAHHAEFDIAA